MTPWRRPRCDTFARAIRNGFTDTLRLAEAELVFSQLDQAPVPVATAQTRVLGRAARARLGRATRVA